MDRISTLLRRSATLVTGLALATTGLTALAGNAHAATAPPWHWSEVTGTASLTWYSSKTVSLQCPSGYVPVSGGFTATDGGLRLKGQHADLSTNQFVFTFGNSTPTTQTADINAWCASSSDVGSITTATKSSLGLVPGGTRQSVYVNCPDSDPTDNTRDYVPIAGDAEWGSTGSRTIEFLGPLNGIGWEAVGTSATNDDVLTVTMRCVPSPFALNLVTNAASVSAAGAHSVTATCPSGQRVLSGGTLPTLASGETNTADHGYTVASRGTRTTWSATVHSIGADTIKATAVCVSTNVPTVSWTSTPPGMTNATSGQFSYAASDPFGQPVTATCTLDNTVTWSCSGGTISYGPLAERYHTLELDVVNADGEHAVISYLWIIDLTAPTVTASGPTDGAPVGSAPTATFSEAISGVSTTSFTLVDDVSGQPVAGTVTTSTTSGTSCTTNCRKATFTPTVALSGHHSYTAQLTSGVHDLAGNPLAPVSWQFDTANRAPACNDTGATTGVNVQLQLSLGCADADGDPLNYEVVDGPTHGQTDAPTSDGAASYTPDAGYVGTDTFTFRASDAFGGSSPVATATIDVGPNHSPQCQDVAQPVGYESPAIVTTDCTDADAGQALTTVVDSAPAHGGLTTLSSDDGSFTYTPSAGYTGQDTFTYHATDGYGGSSTVKTVTLYVATDAPPTCDAETVKVKHATAISVPLSCADTDTGQTLTLSIGTPPAHGSLTNMTQTQVTYTPKASFGGTDTFTYTANDGHGATSVPATVSLKVAPGTTALSLSARTLTLQVGHSDRLTTRLRDTVTGRYLNGQKVLLQTRTSTSSAWSTVTSATTQTVGTKTGCAVFTVKPTRSRYYRVVYRGAPAYLASSSTALRVKVTS